MSLADTLRTLKLSWIRDNIETELADSARKQRSTQAIIERLFTGELEHRAARAVQRNLKAAHMPTRKHLDSFDWSWPKKINKDQVRHLATLDFLEQKANVVFIGSTGLGKTHLALALGYEACQRNHTVRFTSAAAIINTLTAAMDANQLPTVIKRYTAPELLVVDELGYLPIDQIGANLLFQVFSARYEHASTIITTNRPFKDWAHTFNNDAMLASIVLDRIIHHCEVVIIEGRSYRLKERIEMEPT
jgi:DNA replication protein DnaC